MNDSYYDGNSEMYEAMKNAERDDINPNSLEKESKIQDLVNQKIIMDSLRLILLNTNASNYIKTLDALKCASDDTERILQDLKKSFFKI